MKSDANETLARQWKMLAAVPRAPVRITVAELEQKLLDEGFRVARRTIERDLQSLSARFPLVVDDRSKPFGWSWARDAAFAFMPALAPAQAVALLLAQRHLEGLVPYAMRNELEPLFGSAMRTLGDSGWSDWHRRTAVLALQFQPQPPAIDGEILATVQRAIARRHVLDLEYKEKGGTGARRRIAHPLGLFQRGPVTYLVATLFNYPDVRHMAVHRIAAAVDTLERSREPVGFDLSQHLAHEGALLRSAGVIRFEADFRADAAAHLHETPLSPDQEITGLENGWVRVTATVENDMRFRWWLLAFGAQVRVRQPSALREDIAAEVGEARALYIQPEKSGS
ncbi:hypothetical protein GCM10028862_03220 [Luteimonas pelagia]